MACAFIAALTWPAADALDHASPPAAHVGVGRAWALERAGENIEAGPGAVGRGLLHEPVPGLPVAARRPGLAPAIDPERRRAPS